MSATLYVQPDCAACAELRRGLRSAGIFFEEIDVVQSPEIVPELLKLTRGRRIVPVLVDDSGVHVAPCGGSMF